MENGVEDIEKNNDTFIFWTSPENFTFIRDNVRNEGFVIESAEMEIVSNSSQKLEDSKGEKIINLLNELENHDDVNNIHTNFTM